jgi:hypothetical protein
MSVTMVVIAQVTGPDKRGRGGGVAGIVAGLAVVVGPLVGGAPRGPRELAVDLLRQSPARRRWRLPARSCCC